MAEIKHKLEIAAPPDVVYRAITTEKGLKGWWSEQSSVAARVGAVMEVRFGSRYRNLLRIDVLEDDQRVEWACEAGDEQWVGTNLLFDLEASGRGTVLRFCHAGWRQESDFFASCNTQWGLYLDSLRDYCESGHGRPFCVPDKETA